VDDDALDVRVVEPAHAGAFDDPPAAVLVTHAPFDRLRRASRHDAREHLLDAFAVFRMDELERIATDHPRDFVSEHPLDRRALITNPPVGSENANHVGGTFDQRAEELLALAEDFLGALALRRRDPAMAHIAYEAHDRTVGQRAAPAFDGEDGAVTVTHAALHRRDHGGERFEEARPVRFQIFRSDDVRGGSSDQFLEAIAQQFAGARIGVEDGAVRVEQEDPVGGVLEQEAPVSGRQISGHAGSGQGSAKTASGLVERVIDRGTSN
jgi:hypothetical protein